MRNEVAKINGHQVLRSRKLALKWWNQGVTKHYIFQSGKANGGTLTPGSGSFAQNYFQQCVCYKNQVILVKRVPCSDVLQAPSDATLAPLHEGRLLVLGRNWQ